MSHHPLLGTIAAFALSASVITTAAAHDATRPHRDLRAAKPVRTMHEAQQSLRRSYDWAEPAPVLVGPPVNLFETGRAPAQPGQW